MKKINNKAPRKSSFQKYAVYKSVLFIAVSIAMFVLVPQVFQIAFESFTPDCITRTESGPCEANYGYKVLAAAASVSVIWAVGAIILFIRGVATCVKPAK